MTNSLKSLVDQCGLDISDEKIDQLERFVDLFVQKNEELNLTSISDRNDFLIKHIVDGLMIAKFIQLDPGSGVADLGTGGGLPGIPLAILYPDVQFTLVDSVQKKIEVVREFSETLGLNNVQGVADRLEVLGRDKRYREQYDVVIARALAPLSTLLELATPFVKPGGVFVAMKGPGYLEEVNEATNAMKQLKLTQPRAERYELPEEKGKRYLLVFEKMRATPMAYPRRIGMPKKRPL